MFASRIVMFQEIYNSLLLVDKFVIMLFYAFFFVLLKQNSQVKLRNTCCRWKRKFVIVIRRKMV